jgi:hypothetical protein
MLRSARDQSMHPQAFRGPCINSFGMRFSHENRTAELRAFRKLRNALR